MIPSSFDYAAPSTIDEAIALLGAHAGDAKILAGGQSLIPMFELGPGSRSLLVDIDHDSSLTHA
jgi:carbon-monoxide dehydrogenase medium subunit